MNVTIALHLNQLKTLSNQELPEEVILSCRELSRFGEDRFEELQSKALELFKGGVRCVLEWDILQTEQDFKRTSEFLLAQDLSCFSAVRVQDMGAFYFALQHLPLPIHLVLETGHHNTEGLKTLLEFGKEKLSRVVLSLEFPKDKLKELMALVRKEGVETELLGLGRILLFYTPRKLLGVHVEGGLSGEEVVEKNYSALATSEESPHSGFPVVENYHGTFMFNTKDHALFDQVELLETFGLEWFRFDGRFIDSEKLLAQLLATLKTLIANYSDERASELRQLYPQKCIRGFFQTNRSNVLFPKLKNQRIQRQREDYLGEVLDGAKGEYLLIQVRRENESIRLGDTVTFLTPEGKTRTAQIRALADGQGQSKEELAYGQIGMIPWVSSVVRRSLITKSH